MFTVLPPSPQLAGLVHAYWFVEDLPGEHEGRPILTSPISLAVLSVNMGRPNATEKGELVPATSFLGLQSRVRSWRSWSETYFVMAMLTIPGVLRLFPNTGSASVDALLDLGAITGEAASRSLTECVGIDLPPAKIAASLDTWLISRLGTVCAAPETGEIVAALNMLRQGGRVDAAAKHAQVDRRQIHRMFRRHLGVGPKELADLERLHASLKGVQTGYGDPVQGFSDQSHQIRHWRRRLGTTPGTYARQARAPMTDYFGADHAVSGLAYYL